MATAKIGFRFKDASPTFHGDKINMILNIGFNENSAHATTRANELANWPRIFFNFSLAQSLDIFEDMQADKLIESNILKRIFNHITGWPR